MTNLRRQLNSVLRTIGTALITSFLYVITALSPNCGAWIKRLFFILTTYHELQRRHLFNDMTLANLNEKLLQIKQPSFLTDASEIAQWKILQCDLSELTQIGIDLDKVLSTGNCSLSEAQVIGEIIAKQTPVALRYGETAMVNDIVRLLCQVPREA